jgi:putative solute:sodium symporter small subunit
MTTMTDLDPGAARRRAVLAARAIHWRRTRRVTGVLAALWLATTFCTVFYARDLAGLSLFGWPLSFYLAAQGASLIYLAIIGVYAWTMRRIDRRYARALQSAGFAP